MVLSEITTCMDQKVLNFDTFIWFHLVCWGKRDLRGPRLPQGLGTLQTEAGPTAAHSLTPFRLLGSVDWAQSSLWLLPPPGLPSEAEMVLSHTHAASNLSTSFTARSAQAQLDAALGLDGLAPGAPGHLLRASLAHTVPGLRRWGLPFSVDGRGHFQVGGGLGAGAPGVAGPRDTHGFASAQSAGHRVAAGLMASVDGEQLHVALEARRQPGHGGLALELHHGLSALLGTVPAWLQVSNQPEGISQPPLLTHFLGHQRDSCHLQGPSLDPAPLPRPCHLGPSSCPPIFPPSNSAFSLPSPHPELNSSSPVHPSSPPPVLWSY